MSVKIAYKGVEIESIDTPQIFDPPKRMVTWCYRDGECCDVKEQDVVAILPPLPGHVSVMCRSAVAVRWAAYCAEIPEAPKSRRATNREFAKWLAQGNGEVWYGGDAAYPCKSYPLEDADRGVGVQAKVRKWGDTKWHAPTVDYMGIEG